MKIPNYMYEPVPNFARNGLALAAKALRIDAKLARKQKCNPEFSRALEYAADRLQLAADENTCLATAFEFPENGLSESKASQ